MKIEEIFDNKQQIEKLLSLKSILVPFIGAGFSRPLCPTWADFLEGYFQNAREEYFLPEDEKQYLKLNNSTAANKYELMADLLIAKTSRRRFEEEIKARFDKPILPDMKRKYQLLHLAFPHLKITTNFDRLIERNAGDEYMDISRGDNAQELERLFTKRFELNSLLKIHGGLEDPPSIILSTEQYAKLYGHDTEFDPNADFPRFLIRVFTNCSLLFIGCSLWRDRSLMVLESLRDVQPHFAIMFRPENRNELVPLNRRLSHFRITPIWVTDFHQIDELLEMLAPPKLITPSRLPLDHGVTFVGREKELQQIKESILQSNGGVQMISGHLFSLDGAGGVGKTTLAIEVAKQCAAHFKHGVLPPIRVDEHNPISFVMQLAAEFNLKDVEEPPDKETAQRLVTAILKDRQALLILDNAVKWQNLRYMLPFQTKSTILITTRNRDIFRHLRLHCRENMPVEEVSLEIFSEAEALQLFREMLNSDYHGKEKDTYLKIAVTLGFLPLALRQAISLMLFGPHYTAERLLEKLENEDRLALLKKGHAAEGSDSRTIETVFDLSPDLLTKELTETMEYLAVCAPGPVPLAFLQRLIQNEAIDEHLEQLHSFSWCDRRKLDGELFYELHQLVRELVHKRFNKRFSKDFIETVHQIFTDENIHFTEKESLFTQLNEALNQAVAAMNERLTDWLYDLYDFCRYRGYFDFYVRLTEHAEKLFPEDKWTLRTAYAHRALILSDWGQLEEAMALHRKQQKICDELGDRAGLARSYGNQALILQAWGQLEEAMALHRKEQKIKDELGDRAGLAACYGNQALILSDWGQLEEAMALHRKEQKICDELGDRAGLAISWWNQGIIYGEKGDKKKQIELWRKSIEMNKAIGIPTTEDEKALEELISDS